MFSLVSFSILKIGYYVFESDIAKYSVEFDAERWKNWQESELEFRLRWEMIGSLCWKHKLVGKRKLK